ncbi:MAG: hypothetical protein R3Y28_06055 [Candidatus Gastranaerophilales bacterium]
MGSNFDPNQISIIGIIIATLMAIISLIVQFLIFKNTQTIQKGQNEISIREMIENAKSEVAKLATNISEESQINSALVAHESVKNMYDEACKKYLENKIDRKSFESIYEFEIKQIVDSEKDFYLSNKNKFEATLKVYEQWTNKKNFKTKLKELFRNNKIVKKVAVFIIILILAVGIWYLSGCWQNFISAILVVLVGCLLPLLFDVTDSIIETVKQIKDNTNEENYTKSIESYNQLLLYFGQFMSLFLCANLDDDSKIKMKSSDNISNVTESFKFLIKNPFSFKREGNPRKWVANEYSFGNFIKAEGCLADINRLLMSLPKELKFSRDRYAPFINLQSGFYQLKNQLLNDCGSEASEAIMKSFLSDFVNFIEL